LVIGLFVAFIDVAIQKIGELEARDCEVKQYVMTGVKYKYINGHCLKPSQYERYVYYKEHGEPKPPIKSEPIMTWSSSGSGHAIWSREIEIEAEVD